MSEETLLSDVPQTLKVELDAEAMIALIREWFEVFEVLDPSNKGEVDDGKEDSHSLRAQKIVDLYVEDATHYSPKLADRQPETEGTIHGRQALKEWWAGCFRKTPGLRYELLAGDDAPSVEGNVVTAKYIRYAEGAESMRVTETYEIVEVAEGLRIKASKVFHDQEGKASV